MSGEVGDRSFYARFAVGKDDGADVVRGFTISYPKPAAVRLDPVTLAVAASFEPFPSAAKAPETQKPPAAAAEVPVPPPAPVPPRLIDAVLVGPDLALARVSRGTCANPKVDGATAAFRNEDRKTGLALLNVPRRPDSPVLMATKDVVQGEALIALFRGAAPGGPGPGTPLEAASVEVSGTPEPSSVAFDVSAPLQGRAAFLFDRSGALAGITERGGKTPPAIAGTVLQADYRATGAAPIAAFLASSGLAPGAAASRPTLGFGDVVSGARLSIIPVTCEAAGDRAALRRSYRGARLARMRCSVRRCMLSRRAVSDTLRPHSS